MYSIRDLQRVRHEGGRAEMVLCDGTLELIAEGLEKMRGLSASERGRRGRHLRIPRKPGHRDRPEGERESVPDPRVRRTGVQGCRRVQSRRRVHRLRFGQQKARDNAGAHGPRNLCPIGTREMEKMSSPVKSPVFRFPTTQTASRSTSSSKTMSDASRRHDAS